MHTLWYFHHFCLLSCHFHRLRPCSHSGPNLGSAWRTALQLLQQAERAKEMDGIVVNSAIRACEQVFRDVLGCGDDPVGLKEGEGWWPWPLPPANSLRNQRCVGRWCILWFLFEVAAVHPTRIFMYRGVWTSRSRHEVWDFHRRWFWLDAVSGLRPATCICVCNAQSCPVVSVSFGLGHVLNKSFTFDHGLLTLSGSSMVDRFASAATFGVPEQHCDKAGGDPCKF